VLLKSAERDTRSKHKSLVRLAKIDYLRGEFDKAAAHAAAASAFVAENWQKPCEDGMFWEACSRLRLGQSEKAKALADELKVRNPAYPKLDILLAKIGESETKK